MQTFIQLDDGPLRHIRHGDRMIIRPSGYVCGGDDVYDIGVRVLELQMAKCVKLIIKADGHEDLTLVIKGR